MLSAWLLELLVLPLLQLRRKNPNCANSNCNGLFPFDRKLSCWIFGNTTLCAILCSKHSNWLNLVCCAYIFKRLFTFISSFLKMPTFTLPPLTVSCSFCSKFCFLSLCCADVSYFTSYENRNETKLLCPSVLLCKQSVLVLYLHYKYCESLLFKYIFKL